MKSRYVIRRGLVRGQGEYWNPIADEYPWSPMQCQAIRVYGRENSEYEAARTGRTCRIVRLVARPRADAGET